MGVTLGGLVELVLLTFRSPREAALVLMRMDLPDGARWSALVLMAVASAMVMSAVASLTPAIGPDGAVIPLPSPFFWAGMVGFGMGMTALLAYAVGRWRGGRGTLPDAVLLVAWLQVVQLVLMAAQLLLLVAVPPLESLFELGSVLVFLWLLTNFVAEMHGFRSTGRVLAGVLATFFALVLGMTVLLMPFIPAGM